ncbi:glycosyltransferase family 4 protein [Burkholderia dolosa]|uniref:glycosyltransferase family 4 protein n=1 Tax=Burkholderia dolosa TaxID=152500 RepID=UPI001B9653D8|nr:glycosyltransferase family 4 protein [Burkholderia dolosa]MBR8060556.1 glycosyltransferase family 4 protein [Burkholderia dolosa]
MKIGVSANALKHGGGLERYAIDIARGMAEAGVMPAFFARSVDTSIPEARLVEPHRINVSFLPGKLRDEWFAWRLNAARRAANVDVLIGCNRVPGSEIAICGGTHRGFLQALGRAPTYFDRRQVALESRQYETAGYVVAHSRMMRDELRTLYGVDDDRIRMLYPPVDAQRFTPVRDDVRAALRRRFGFGERDVVLLFPSSSHVRKGLPLIETALRGSDASVVVAVAGRPPERTSRQVRYVGYVKNIEDGYRAADYTILASRYEPFGLVGIESVMCGTPVILPPTLGCHDVIAEHAKLTFAADDVDALRAVLATAASRARTIDRAEVARDAVRYDPSVRHHVDQLLALARAVHERTPV